MRRMAANGWAFPVGGGEGYALQEQEGAGRWYWWTYQGGDLYEGWAGTLERAKTQARKAVQG